jgi:hypothetical protein
MLKYFKDELQKMMDVIKPGITVALTPVLAIAKNRRKA